MHFVLRLTSPYYILSQRKRRDWATSDQKPISPDYANIPFSIMLPIKWCAPCLAAMCKGVSQASLWIDTSATLLKHNYCFWVSVCGLQLNFSVLSVLHYHFSRRSESHFSKQRAKKGHFSALYRLLVLHSFRHCRKTILHQNPLRSFWTKNIAWKMHGNMIF